MIHSSETINFITKSPFWIDIDFRCTTGCPKKLPLILFSQGSVCQALRPATAVRDNALPGKGPSMSRNQLYHIWNTMLISIKLCTHIGQIDGEVAEIPRMLQLSQLILGNSLNIIMLTVSAYLKSRKFLRVLLACGKCYAQNTRFTTVIIDKPTGHQRYITE
jgi:hypothetical protein